MSQLSRFRIRFSLRSMLAAMTLMAVYAYWLALPSLNAYRFKQAVETGNCRTLVRLLPTEEADHVFGNSRLIRVKPLNWRQLWSGERYVIISGKCHSGSRYIFSVVYRATRRGLKPADSLN